MKAMILEGVVPLDGSSGPLRLVDLPMPKPGPDEVLIRVHACGVCHTEIDEIEGRTPPSLLPVILGHQVIGEVAECGTGVTGISPGSRRGVAWIYSACGSCALCRGGFENLCRNFRATGRDAHGGYAEYMVAPAAFTYKIPDVFSDAGAAPLLCAGSIGYRSLKLSGLKNGSVLGLTGFGASAHLVLRLARFLYPRSPVFVFARSRSEQDFARMLGAEWAGDTDALSPEPCDVVIDTTPAWKPVLFALERLRPGGRLIINAIRKEAADSVLMAGINFEHHLWMEKEIKSVANITRADVREFLEIAVSMPLKPDVQLYTLEEANQALLDIKHSRIRGAKVLQI